jgi:hypothetical protein
MAPVTTQNAPAETDSLKFDPETFKLGNKKENVSFRQPPINTLLRYKEAGIDISGTSDRTPSHIERR